jgi:hypothetical protein
MKALRVVLVILGIYALLHVATQSFRHAFEVLVEPRTSILTMLDPAKEQITSTESLAELIKQYEAAKKKATEWKVGKTDEEIRQAEFSQEGPTYTVRLYRETIERWETRQRKLYEVHFYWWCGIACLVLGIVCWRRINPWLGTAIFIVAFAEMIYWTTPEFRIWSDNEEFTRLVSWKLLYSGVTLLILVIMWIQLLVPLLTTSSVSKTV